MARVRQAEHSANAALDNARLELASASTELDAAREIVSTQEKAVELAPETLDRRGLLRERSHHRDRPNRRTTVVSPPEGRGSEASAGQIDTAGNTRGAAAGQGYD